MTIKQFAQEHGISEQAVYKRLRNQGIKTTELRNHENPSSKGELSDEGLNRLNRLFNNQWTTINPVKQPVEQPDKIDTLTAENERLRNQLETATAKAEQLTSRVKELETENARLTGKLEAYEATSATLAAMQERTSDALTTAQRLADQAQQLHAMQLKALPGGGVKGWFSKLFNRKGDGE